MKMPKRLVASSFAIILSLGIIFNPIFAYAYSGYGSGTSVNPYRISTCSQLEEIANNTSGYYVLNNNINCNNAVFTPISTFSGTLDGQNHSISNIDFTTCGIFCATSGATIENINVASGSFNALSSTNYNATFVGGLAENSTLNNVHSSLTMTSTTNVGYIAGLVAFDDSGNTITNSSYSGTLNDQSSDGWTGGLVGLINGSNNTLSNDFFNGTINIEASSAYQTVGGLAGGTLGGTIDKSFSAGEINVGNSNNDWVGGAEGLISSGNLTNSFTAVVLTGSTATEEGALLGSTYNGANLSTDNFDATNAGTTTCVGGGEATCSSVNVSNSNPYYYYNTSSAAPLNTWDFNNTWSKVTGTYPTLTDLSPFNKSLSIPNSGDINNDGNNNTYENNVADFTDANSSWYSVTIPNNDGCIVGSGQAENASGVTTLSGYTSSTNLAAFNIYCSTSGQTVPVTIIFPGYFPNAVAKYFNSSTNQYTSIPGAQYSTVTVGGVQKTEVSYSITDGGLLDEDNSANGVIVDPVGLYTPNSVITASSISSPDTGVASASNSSNPFILLSLAFSIVLITLSLRKYGNTKI